MESIIFSLDGNTHLVSQLLPKISDQVIKGKFKSLKFADGELSVEYDDSVRGKRVYLLSTANNSDKIIKLILAIDAAKRSGASQIIPILPYYPYARMDKRDNRSAIGARVFADMVSNAGATSVITFDLHSPQIDGMFSIPVTHIEGKNVFDSYVKEMCNGTNSILAGPDAGSSKRVKSLQYQVKDRYKIDLHIIMIDKTRVEANKVESMLVIGDVKGKDVIIYDDMADTATTLVKAAQTLIDEGAVSVSAVISHGVFSGTALEKIHNSVLKEVIISDSIDLESLVIEKNINRSYLNKITVVTLAEQIKLAIKAINENASYQALNTNYN